MVSNEKGWALPLVLVVMFVLSLLGTALWHYGTSQTLQVSRYEKKMQAHYIARSGAEAMSAWLDNNRTTQEGLIQNLLDHGYVSDPVILGSGTFTVSISGTLTNITLKSVGEVGGVKDEVVIVMKYISAGLPEPEDATSVFPPEYQNPDTFKPGTDAIGGTEWVNTATGNITGGNDLSTAETAVLFPGTVDVRHQTGQQSFDFYARFMFFENTNRSLYVKNGNILRLHTDTVVFKGEVALNQAGPGNYAELSLHVLPGYGVVIDGQLYGKVYFYKDVIQTIDAISTGVVIIPKGAYYFTDGTIIRSTPAVIPPLASGGLIPLTGDSGTVLWQ